MAFHIFGCYNHLSAGIQCHNLIANRQLKRLSDLVENILAMSIERRKTMKLEMDVFPLVPFIEEIAEANRTRQEKQIEIEVIPVFTEISIRADRQHFSNAIGNIIDNAIKYSGDSVNIKIHISSGSIIISDNGNGIPSKSIPLIFNKFYRVPMGNIQEIRGYGIGLYYVKEILEKMNMSISVASEMGNGTSFTITYSRYE